MDTSKDPPAAPERTRISSTIYKLIFTPLNFIAFVISLYVVDWRYQEERARHDPRRSRRWLPAWLHRSLFPSEPYEWVDVAKSTTTTATTTTTTTRTTTVRSGRKQGWYYHSQQRKLMRMEAADAIALRGTVMVVLFFVLVVFCLLAWRVVGWASKFVARVLR